MRVHRGAGLFVLNPRYTLINFSHNIDDNDREQDGCNAYKNHHREKRAEHTAQTRKPAQANQSFSRYGPQNNFRNY